MMFKAEELIKQAIEKYKPNIFVAFSGGKCSQVVLHMALEYWGGIPVVFNNTGVEFPETVGFVHKLKKDWNLNLIETKPFKKTFWDCVKEYGLPSFKSGIRGKKFPKCCYYLKEKPTALIIKEKGFKADFTGIRQEESWNRFNLIRMCGQRYYNKKLNMFRHHPIAYWKEKEVLDYIEEHNLPINPVYIKWDGIYKRCGCLSCTSYLDWKKKLSVSHPKLLTKLLQIDGQKQLTEVSADSSHN